MTYIPRLYWLIETGSVGEYIGYISDLASVPSTDILIERLLTLKQGAHIRDVKCIPIPYKTIYTATYIGLSGSHH
jgi:hypothetical protein